LDFYVNGNLQWGIEILCEGIDVNGHLKRFETGSYSKIPFKQWIILDFRHKSRTVKKKQDEKVWHVFYTDKYDKFFIKRRDKPDLEELLLQGDEY